MWLPFETFHNTITTQLYNFYTVEAGQEFFTQKFNGNVFLDITVVLLLSLQIMKSTPNMNKGILVIEDCNGCLVILAPVKMKILAITKITVLVNRPETTVKNSQS